MGQFLRFQQNLLEDSASRLVSSRVVVSELQHEPLATNQIKPALASSQRSPVISILAAISRPRMLRGLDPLFFLSFCLD